MSKLKKIANSYGFSDVEMKVLLFIILMFLAGSSFSFFISEEPTEVINFDYSSADSLFEMASQTDVNAESLNKIPVPNVDYKQEVLDFNDADFNSNSVVKKKISGRVNINTADIKQFMELPGVGQKTAERIIEYRSSRGKFTSKRDLLQVKGIGSTKFEKFKDLIFIENGK
jgi:competence ComEA-like helix-hairpin-helix protein